MVNSTAFRIGSAIIGVFFFIGLMFQEKLMVQLKQPSISADTGTANTTTIVDCPLVSTSDSDTTDTNTSTSTSTFTSAATSLERTLATPVTISEESPLFVLSLTNHWDLAIPRYFECAGYQSEKKDDKDKSSTTLGRHWLSPDMQPNKNPVQKAAIGQCLHDNMRSDKPLTEGCGKFHVWMDLQFLKAPFFKTKRRPYVKPDCFDPVMYPGALELLAKSYPKGATIFNVKQDPMEWVNTLSPQFPQFWLEWCNDSHNNTFPGQHEYNQKRPLLGFYLEYQHRLQQFVKAHPEWTYVEIDLTQQENSIAARLQDRLGIEPTCWTKATQGTIKHDANDPVVTNLLTEQKRPNAVSFPMLVTAMPKAGTSTMHDYFRCGMGEWAGAHQWTTLTHESYEPGKFTTVGECLIENTNNDTYPFFKGCGNALVWSDTGVLRNNRPPVCYFPFLHRQGLERFVASYPYGTILHVVRNTTSWVSSALRWRNMPQRWVKAGCQNGFPTGNNITEADWADFYEGVTEKVRAFTKEHPTLTYIEVPLSDQTGDMLHDVFGFPSDCWGHKNVNKKVPEEDKKDNETKANKRRYR